jgi:hypothetical protein
MEAPSFPSWTRKLGLETTKEEMTVTTLESTIEKEQQMCHATLSSMDQPYVLENSKLMLAESLPTITYPVPKNKDIADYAHLRVIKVIELPKGKKVSLIIGTDEPSAHVPSKERRGSRFEPQAMQTPFGWTVVSTGSSNGQCAYIQKADEEIHSLFEKMYNHDFQDAHIEKQRRCGRTLSSWSMANTSLTYPEKKDTGPKSNFQIAQQWP